MTISISSLSFSNRYRKALSPPPPPPEPFSPSESIHPYSRNNASDAHGLLKDPHSAPSPRLSQLVFPKRVPTYLCTPGACVSPWPPQNNNNDNNTIRPHSEPRVASSRTTCERERDNSSANPPPLRPLSSLPNTDDPAMLCIPSPCCYSSHQPALSLQPHVASSACHREPFFPFPSLACIPCAEYPLMSVSLPHSYESPCMPNISSRSFRISNHTRCITVVI